MTARHRLRIPPTETFRRRVLWTAAGVPVDLTGCAARLVCRTFTGDIALDLAEDAGITLGGGAGTFDLYAPLAAVSGLDGSGEYLLTVRLANGDTRALLCGPVDYAPCADGAIDGDIVVDGRETITVLTTGRQGPPGVGGGTASELPAPVMADVIAGAGWPIAIDRATGRGRMARADTYVRSFVVGLSAGAAALDHPCELSAAVLALADWTGPAGAADLLPGRPYFLALAGGITATPPTAGGQAVVPIGTALSARTLEIILNPPILL